MPADFRTLAITGDDGYRWLEHFPDGDEPCDESPICPVEPGDTLARIVAKARDHTCEVSDATP